MKPYYQREGVTLYLGDCREVVPALEERGIVLVDPPYSPHTHMKSRAGRAGDSRPAGGLTLTGEGRASRANISRAVDFGFAPLSGSLRYFLAEQAARLADRWVLFFSDDEGVGAWRATLRESGLEAIRTGAWIKLGSTPQFTGDRPAVGHEEILIAHALAPNGKPMAKRWNGGGKPAIYSVPIVLERGGGHEARVHETQKPEALILALIDDFTEPGELVYDFTAGSGTSLVCALRRGRRATGIEQREKDCEGVALRLEAEFSGISRTPAMAKGQMGLHEARAPVTPEIKPIAVRGRKPRTSSTKVTT